MKKLRSYISGEDKSFDAMWHEGGENHAKSFTLDMFVEDDAAEWQYALCDIANELNALEVGETMYFQGNRDDKNSKGYIIRIS